MPKIRLTSRKNRGSRPGLDIQDGLSTCKGRALFAGLPHWLDKSFIAPVIELESGLHCGAETRVGRVDCISRKWGFRRARARAP